jgi:polyhydroxyalkanoate synthesis regulator protein
LLEQVVLEFRHQLQELLLSMLEVVVAEQTKAQAALVEQVAVVLVQAQTQPLEAALPTQAAEAVVRAQATRLSLLEHQEQVAQA